METYCFPPTEYVIGGAVAIASIFGDSQSSAPVAVLSACRLPLPVLPPVVPTNVRFDAVLVDPLMHGASHTWCQIRLFVRTSNAVNVPVCVVVGLVRPRTPTPLTPGTSVCEAFGT